jgi:hypothetical protein
VKQEIHDTVDRVPVGVPVRRAGYSRVEITRLIDSAPAGGSRIGRVLSVLRDMLDDALDGECPSHARYISTCSHCAWRYEIPANSEVPR